MKLTVYMTLEEMKKVYHCLDVPENKGDIGTFWPEKCGFNMSIFALHVRELTELPKKSV